MIKSHAELEAEHYQALSNPYYVLEGMMSVMNEELMMNMPISPLPIETHIERPTKTEVIYRYVYPEKKSKRPSKYN